MSQITSTIQRARNTVCWHQSTDFLKGQCAPNLCLFAMLLIILSMSAGCAALKPVSGIPARYMPDQFKPNPRSGKRTIDLSLLRQTPPRQYLLDSGDLLAIYIEGVLGQRDQIPPVYYPQNREQAPSYGYPIPVREDGTISIPMVDPINVRGMTITQVEDEIRKRLTIDRPILKPGRDRILVSMQQKRTYRVLVIRQEAGSFDATTGGQGSINPGVLKRGIGRVVSLAAYQNDVLHAMAETGGLPGLDAENAIYIIRQKKTRRKDKIIPVPVPPLPIGEQGDVSSVTLSHYSPSRSSGNTSASNIRLTGDTTTAQTNGNHSLPQLYPEPDPVSNGGSPQPPVLSNNVPIPEEDYSGMEGYVPYNDFTMSNKNVIRVPVRLGPGDYPNFSEQDIILEDGDIVFVESRDTEIFYTGGLLGGGQYTLPRDYDLDILGAISIAESSQQGAQGNQVGGVSALNQDVSISASNVIILRKLPNGKQVPIKVDLYKAIRNPEERIVVQPGDYIMLQYTKWEAGWAFIERHLLEGALFSLAAAQFNNGSSN